MIERRLNLSDPIYNTGHSNNTPQITLLHCNYTMMNTKMYSNLLTKMHEEHTYGFNRTKDLNHKLRTEPDSHINKLCAKLTN